MARSTVFTLEKGYYIAKDFGGSSDKMEVDVLDDCVIGLSTVFSE